MKYYFHTCSGYVGTDTSEEIHGDFNDEHGAIEALGGSQECLNMAIEIQGVEWWVSTEED